MRKKVLLLVGITVLSMFLFVQPIKAETETLGIIPTDDISISCEWDRDDFFLRGLSSNPTDDIFFGVENMIGGEYEEHRPYLKYDIPDIPNKVIVSIELRVLVPPYFFETDIIPQFDWNISVDLVSNNWDEYNINWTHGRPEYMNETINMVMEDVQNTYVYNRFDLTYFKDFIKNGTLSFCMIPSKLYDNYLTEGYMGFYSKEGFSAGYDVNPYLIVEYEDIRPPTPFTLASNAGNPDRDGNIILDWTYSELAHTYSVYQNDSLLESGLTNHLYLVEISSNGIYSFKIVAFNEFGNISSNEITVNVEVQYIHPTLFTLTSNAGDPDIDGIFTLDWTNSEYAYYYSVYRNDNLLESGLTVNTYLMEISTNGNYTFKIIAFNDYGNTSSNEINVKVVFYPDADHYYTDIEQYFGTVVAYNADQYDLFNASIWSDDVITGFIMDESNFNQWVDAGYIQPQPPIVYERFGSTNEWHTFNPTHNDTWYFVFVNEYASITHIDFYVYFHEDYFTEPEPEPEPEPTARSDNAIPFIVGFGVAGLAVVVIGEVYRIRK